MQQATGQKEKDKKYKQNLLNSPGINHKKVRIYMHISFIVLTTTITKLEFNIQIAHHSSIAHIHSVVSVYFNIIDGVIE